MVCVVVTVGCAFPNEKPPLAAGCAGAGAVVVEGEEEALFPNEKPPPVVPDAACG